MARGVPVVEHGVGVSGTVPQGQRPQDIQAAIVLELQRLIAEISHNTNVTGISDVLTCATDQPHAQPIQPDQPIQGIRRPVLTDRRAGGSVTLAASIPTLIVSANNGRTGGQIVVSGTAAVTLYLGTVADVSAGVANVPQIYLTPGGSWDLLLSKVLWVGNITAVAATGGSAVAVALT